MSRTVLQAALLMSAVVVLSACTSSRDFDDIRAEMQRLDERPTGQVPEVPIYESQELFTYSAGGRRSPFRSPQAAIEEVVEIVETGIAPDQDRSRQPLEHFALDELTMVGHMESASRGLRALVVDPTGELHQVQPEHYMGQNHGRVVAVSRTEVELLEIVPSGRGGWLERPNTLRVTE